MFRFSPVRLQTVRQTSNFTNHSRGRRASSASPPPPRPHSGIAPARSLQSLLAFDWSEPADYPAGWSLIGLSAADWSHRRDVFASAAGGACRRDNAEIFSCSAVQYTTHAPAMIFIENRVLDSISISSCQCKLNNAKPSLKNEKIKINFKKD